MIPAVEARPWRLLAVVDVPANTACSAQTGSYSDTGLVINTWAVQVGGSQTKYSCIENTGPSPHTLVVGQTGSLPAGVTFSSVGGTVNGGGFLLVSFTLTATSSAAVGASLSFTVTIS